jgi:hypothetical protein
VGDDEIERRPKHDGHDGHESGGGSGDSNGMGSVLRADPPAVHAGRMR